MMRWLIVIFALVSLALFSGCRVFVEPFVCLSGVCPSDESRLATIPWSPSILGKKDCQSIDGVYKELIWYKNNKNGESLIRQFDFRLHRDDKNPREAGMQASYEDSQKIPSTLVEHTVTYTPIERVGKRYMKMPPKEKKAIDHDESAFYKNAVTSIKQQSNLLEVILMDAKGTAYKKSTLNLNHPQMGCVDGDLVIRTMYIGGGE